MSQNPNKITNLSIDIDGIPSVNMDVNDIVAKRINNSHYILSTDDGVIFNPLEHRNRIKTIDRQKGRPIFNFTKCNKDCFEYYVSYLRDKNNTHLVLAQRMFYNEHRSF